MRKFLSIAILSLMLLSSLAVLLPGGAHGAAADTRATAPTNLTVLNVPFKSEAQVDTHFATGYLLTTDTIKNLTYSYSLNENAAALTATKPESGWFLIGGFAPSLNTTIQFDVKLTNPGANGGTIRFKSALFDFSLTEYETYYHLSILYYNETGGINTWSQNTAIFGNLPWIHVTFSWHANRTFFFKFSNATETFFTGWNCTHQDYTYSQQQTMFPPWFFVNVGPGSLVSDGTSETAYIRNLTQTISLDSTKDVFGYVPQHRYAALGFDAPYNVTVQNALPLLEKYGDKATWFFDWVYENNTVDANLSGWNFTNMKAILGDGQEFGIHTNDSLATYDTANQTALNSEFKYLISLAEKAGWKNSSFVWTSLGNGYAWQFNDYAWQYWNAIGRKVWGHYDSNQGYLSDTTTGLNVQTAAAKGWSWIGYDHRVGGVEEVDITPEQFENFLANNSKNNIHVVGYMQYWTRYAAPEWVYGTLTKQGDAKYEVTVNYDKFTVANGFKAAAKIPGLSSTTTRIYDETAHTYVSDYKVYDWGIVFEAHDLHTYEIMDIVQHEFSISINWTYALLGAMIPLMMFGMVMQWMGDFMGSLKGLFRRGRK